MFVLLGPDFQKIPRDTLLVLPKKKVVPTSRPSRIENVGSNFEEKATDLFASFSLCTLKKTNTQQAKCD